MKEAREHDKLYLQENRKQTPKEYFKFVLGEAAKHLDRLEHPRILDIGCATGDFLYYMRSVYPEARLAGMDVVPSLLERAQEVIPDGRFFQGSICSAGDLPDETFDAVTMCGVHSIFDSVRPWMVNLLSLLKPGGRAYVFGIFNPTDVDVLVKARRSDADQDGPWEPGWNCFSRKTFENVLQSLGVQSFQFQGWKIGLDIPPRPEDPLRSWTFRYEDGTRGVINGTMILHEFMLVEIVR